MSKAAEVRIRIPHRFFLQAFFAPALLISVLSPCTLFNPYLLTFRVPVLVSSGCIVPYFSI